jgi:hypothetical protein
MADFDRDTEDEETPELRDPDADSGREWWWDLDDWGDD